MEKKHFIPDTAPVKPEGMIEDITRDSVEEILGKHDSVWYISVKQVEVFAVDGWQIHIWTDQRRQENIIFISEEYVGKNHIVNWYKSRKLVAKSTMKIPDKRDFIERCVLKQVTPEHLKQ